MSSHGQPVWAQRSRALLVEAVAQGHRIELNKEKKRLHASVPEEVARVLKGKRLLLLQEAESLDWPDSAVFIKLKAGFDLVGDFLRAGVFVNALKPTILSVPQLMDTLKYLKPALLGKVG